MKHSSDMGYGKLEILSKSHLFSKASDTSGAFFQVGHHRFLPRYSRNLTFYMEPSTGWSHSFAVRCYMFITDNGVSKHQFGLATLLNSTVVTDVCFHFIPSASWTRTTVPQSYFVSNIQKQASLVTLLHFSVIGCWDQMHSHTFSFPHGTCNVFILVAYFTPILLLSDVSAHLLGDQMLFLHLVNCNSASARKVYDSQCIYFIKQQKTRRYFKLPSN